jgi:hypothetical protein
MYGSNIDLLKQSDYPIYARDLRKANATADLHKYNCRSTISMIYKDMNIKYTKIINMKKFN